MNRPAVLYCAPGSGLGHLNRALSVCLELRALDIAAQIVTNSPFATGLARLARFPVVGIQSQTWQADVQAFASAVRPDLLVCDTFPRGMRGEWAQGFPAPALYLARRLKAESVSLLLRDPGWQEGLVQVIAAEDLADEHETALATSGIPVVRLPGRIRLRPGLLPTQIPAELERLLEGGRCSLVVHGGPAEETAELIRRAAAHGDPAVVTPWGNGIAGAPGFEYYPAGNLMERAAHVVTGAGYNAMADMMFQRDRHTAVAFPRRFDDQAARLACWQPASRDGTRDAALAIAAALHR